MRFDVVRHRQPCQWYNRVGCGISLLAVTAAVTAPLRQAILRPDLPLDACVNSYDHADGALHLAAFEMRAEAIVGVGSILPDPLMDEPLAGAPVYWVIHAMAVHPDRRRLGVGATLLSGLIRHAYQTRQPAGIRLDSLPSAIEFYLRYGFAAAVTRCDSATLPMKLPKIDFHSFYYLGDPGRLGVRTRCMHLVYLLAPTLSCRDFITRRTGGLARRAAGVLPRRMDQVHPLPDEAELQRWLHRIAKDDDRVAFGRLFDHFAPRIKAYLLRLGADDSAAEEILQEVMLTLWRRAGCFDGALASVGTWIFTIARNKRIDALRRRHPLDIDLSNDPAFIPDPQAERADSLLEIRQSGLQLRRALADLPAEQAEILKMAYFQDKTHRAIANESGLPLGTVKSRIRLALERLRTALKDS